MTNMTIGQALEQGWKRLKSLDTNARLETEILLSHVLNKNKTYLFAFSETIVRPIHLEQYWQLIEQRFSGVPIAYLTGWREFWSLAFKVNNATLIPRPETERLVELCLELAPNQPNLKILDLGTGSGAIALALAKERPLWHVTACDFSQEALEVAKENAQCNQIDNVTFYQSNWFSHLPNTTYDVIVSNPPYIDTTDPHLQQGDLRFEPASALISADKGLADLNHIINQGRYYLKKNGLLLLEHGYDQRSPIQTILNKLGYINAQCWQDLQGHDRVSGAWHADEI